MIPDNLNDEEMKFHNAIIEEFSSPMNETHPAKLLHHN